MGTFEPIFHDATSCVNDSFSQAALSNAFTPKRHCHIALLAGLLAYVRTITHFSSLLGSRAPLAWSARGFCWFAKRKYHFPGVVPWTFLPGFPDSGGHCHISGPANPVTPPDFVILVVITVCQHSNFRKRQSLGDRFVRSSQTPTFTPPRSAYFGNTWYRHLFDRPNRLRWF